MGDVDVAGAIRRMCLALPGATEKQSHGAPAFFAGRQFVMVWPEGHHDNRFPHMWCAAPPGAQQELVETEPDRFFRPPYVGVRGWVGVRLDGAVDWAEVAAMCEEAFRFVAPAGLLAELDRVRADGRAADRARPGAREEAAGRGRPAAQERAEAQ